MKAILYVLTVMLQGFTLSVAGVGFKTWQYWVIILCTAAAGALWSSISLED